MIYAITADWHIEKNKNLDNIIETAHWILSVCLERKITELFILGDFLNARDKIDSYALNKAVDLLDLFKDNKIHVTLLLGNHEKYSKTLDYSINSIRIFKHHAKVIDKFKVIEHDTYNLIFIPFIDSKDIFETIVEKVKAKIPAGKHNILLLHQPIQGAVLNSASDREDTISIAPDLLKPFHTVLSGHYHFRQTLGNIMYVGSPVQLRHDEEDGNKGLVIFDMQTGTSEFVLNPAFQKYVTINAIEGDIQNKFVRFRLDASNCDKEVEIKEELIQRGAKSIKFIFPTKTDTIIKIDMLNSKDLEEKYVDSNKASLDKEKLLTMAQTIKQQTRQRLLYAD